uniref:NADH dehydrogenase [ubiquinone] 1 beta subcomplex subunit 3 n=1 Tax=Angiostrongylus cantonensis TaxID=6313 RepID=A0A0K0D9S2_ANGCA
LLLFYSLSIVLTDSNWLVVIWVVFTIREVCSISLRVVSSRLLRDPHAIWREVNRLGSEGKWDNINCMPKMFLFGSAKRETYAVYNAINHKTDIWSSSPYGQITKAVFRVMLLISTIQVGVWVYEFVVPEEKRLKYKYRDGHGHH